MPSLTDTSIGPDAPTIYKPLTRQYYTSRLASSVGTHAEEKLEGGKGKLCLGGLAAVLAWRQLLNLPLVHQDPRITQPLPSQVLSETFHRAGSQSGGGGPKLADQEPGGSS